MSVRIKDTDKGATKLLARLLANGALSVGILGAEASTVHAAPHAIGPQQEGSGSANALTIGEIGEIHEFGLGSCPVRSFLADWADQKKDEITNVVIKGGRALARGKLEPIQLLNQIGAWAVGSIQARMSDGSIGPPLSPQTIKRKGSSVPLIDTGQLRSSISYRVDALDLGGGAVAITNAGGAGTADGGAAGAP